MPDVTLKNLTQKQVEYLQKLEREFKLPPGRPDLKDGDDYWSVGEEGDVEDFCWYHDNEDLWHHSQYNAFRMREEAEDHKRYLEAVAKIKESSWVPDWTNPNQEKFVVYYDHIAAKLDTDVCTQCQYFAWAYYETEKDALAAINTLKDYYHILFGVKNNGN